MTTETKIYKVKAPDGTVIKIKGPVGATQEEIISNAQRLYNQPTAEGADKLKGSARSLAQGLTLGFADELEAAARTAPEQLSKEMAMGGLAAQIPTQDTTVPVTQQLSEGLASGMDMRPSIGDSGYKQTRDAIRKEQSQFTSENPLLSTGLELGGALALPFGLGVGGKAIKGLESGLRSGRLAERAKAGAQIGAGAGAITGAGVAPELSDVPGYAAGYGAGGAVGSVIGGEALRSGAKLTGDVFKNVSERLGFGDVNKRATQIIADRLSADELSPQKVQDIFKEYKRLGVDDATIADLGRNLQDLGYQSYVVPGVGKTGVKEFLETRTQELPDEIVQGLINKAKVQSDDFGFNYVQSLTNRQKAAANQAYPDAYTKGIPAEPFKKYANRNIFQQAYQEAVKKADVYGEKLPPFSSIVDADFVDTDMLHKIKIGLDRVVSSRKNPITGKLDALGADVNTVKREFNDLIKQYNPSYAAANKRFADETRIREAYELGLKYNKTTVDELTSKVNNLTEAEKESFRVGLISNVKNALENFKSGDFQRQIFKSPKQKKALLKVFDNTKDYQDFVRQLELQADKLATERRVLKGSQTFENVATSDQELFNSQVLADAAQGNIGRAVSNIMSQGSAKIKYPPRTAEAVRKQLFETDPAQRSKVVEDLLQVLQPQQNRLPAGISPYTFGVSGLMGSE